MKRIVSRVLMAALLLAPAPGLAQSIDFNTGSVSSPIGSFYSAQGVTFSNAKFDAFPVYGAESSFLGGVQMSAISSAYNPKANSAITITFDDVVSFFSIYGTNVGDNGARAEAFDALGNSLGFAEDFDTGVGQFNNPLLSLTFSGIKSVSLYQPLSTSFEGMLWDNMSWRSEGTPVPEPASVSLVAVGALALYSARRRQRKAV